MQSSTRGAGVLLALVVALSPTEAAYAQSYVIVDLGTLGQSSGSNGLNNEGLVAGWSNVVPGEYYGVLSTADGPPLTNLGWLPGGSYSEAHSLNEANQVVGFASAPVPPPGFGTAEHAFLWQDGAMTDLGTLGGPSRRAWAINASGEVVGRSQNAGLGYYGFRWANGVMTLLPGLPGGYPDGEARDINDAGIAVGQSWDATSILRPVAWENATLTKVFDLPAGATGAKAFAINSSNQVVGNSWGAGGSTRAVLWQWDGSATVLPRTRSHTYSNANGINDSGQVVGESFSGGHLLGSSGGPVLWEHGLAFELEDIVVPSPGISILYAYDINEAGQIASTGMAGGGYRAVRLDAIVDGLGLTGPDPGLTNQMNQVAVRGATRGQSVYFVYGLAVGTTAVPTCPAVSIPIANAVRVGSSVADANGHAVFAQVVPPAASGRTIYVGAVEIPSCRVANRTSRYFF